MGRALDGEHLCLEHQGNHSHYDPCNCTICKLELELKLLKECAADAVVEHIARSRVLKMPPADLYVKMARMIEGK